MQKFKSIYFLIIFGFIVSILLANFNLNKFDKIDGTVNHPMIGADINLIWHEAESFKKDIFEGKNFLESGKEYTRTFLPSKIIATISIIFHKDLYQDYTKKLVKIGEKFIFLFLQISFFYLSLIFFYKKLSLFVSDTKTVYFTILFLSIEPTILQWHSTFWTESVYFSLLILTLALIINSNRSFYNFGLIGIMLGLLYLQKSVSILLIVPLIFYFLLIKIDKKFYKIILLSSLYGLILITLGYSNFLKTGSFYILSPQTKEAAQYAYLLPGIYAEKNKKEKNKDFYPIPEIENKWKSENNFDKDNFKDYLELGKFKQSMAIKVMLDNKLITAKLYTLGIINHALLNPFQTYYWHEYNTVKYQGIEYHLSEDKKKLLKYRIVYSLFIFTIILFGLKRIITQKKNILFYLLICTLIAYFTLMLGWIGYTRYFMPSLILMSVFFGNGVSSILDLLKKNNN